MEGGKCQATLKEGAKCPGTLMKCSAFRVCGPVLMKSRGLFQRKKLFFEILILHIWTNLVEN